MTTDSTPISMSDFVAGFWRLRHWPLSAQEVLSYVEQLLEMGIHTMDHAMVYGSEKPFGDALALKPSLRQSMQIVTKCGIRPMGFGELGALSVNHYDSSAEAIRQSLDASLQNLKTDYVDVLLIHRPDFLMDVAEIARTFDDLKQQGKVRAFGVSNFTTTQFALLQQACGGSLITNQIEMSPYHMQALEEGVLEQCQSQGIAPMLWSPLAGGQLLQPQDAKGQRIVQALQVVADELQIEALDVVVYAWLRALPCQARVMLGSSKIERIKAAVVARDIQLNREQWYRIWEASNGASVP